MQIKASESKKLHGLSHYFDELFDLHISNKFPNKIIFSGKKGLGKSTLAYHLINCILSKHEDNKYDQKNYCINNENRSYKLVQNNCHPNFYLIDLIEDKKSIDISQIRELITYTNKSSFNDLPRFILINNLENLNKNSVNALLKIVEEPNDNIFFILIHNNQKKILPTLKSRCITFNINLTFQENLKISSLLLNENILDLINLDLLNYYNTSGDFLSLINFANEKKIDLKRISLIEILDTLISNGYYKKNKYVKKVIINFIELYFLKEYKLTLTKKVFHNMYTNFINKINNTEKFNLDEESLFLEFKLKMLNG